ncbi:metallophosphoesterase [Methanobrevibacter sp.]|uniref:metallophosphoesterase n=1 Tax=Methanobrevibacter sp. TaxID=66852 RepID=UPI002E7817E4|nr:metallophosphoesterase [Methanobrevibacter sp.]MEE0025860.1 metallophosphoesterase [Methanobrevibacter sp.]
MSFRTKRVLISTPFYMVFEFFLLKYMFLLLGGCNDIYIMMMVLLIGLLRSVPMFFEAKKSTIPGRFLTAVDGVWMWASLMFLIDILIIYLIDMFIPLSFEIKIILLAVVPILGVYNYYKAHKLVVNEKTLKLDNLKHDINIVHLSDVHFGSVRHKKIIRQISDKLKELEDTCQLAIISGDLADGSSIVEKDDFLVFKEVNMPIIFTPGNHDFYIDIEDVFEACRNAGIIILDNASMEFEDLNIFGLRFSFEDRSVPEIEESLVKEGFVNIINYHVPYHWEEFSKIGFDIQLSGHTHGGQFYPAVNFAEILFKYNRGLFKNNLGRYLHVTTGVGSMDTPMRWGTDSELVILKLKRN